ncbi:putative sensor domain DACNV-containing protein [Lysinibacillus sp. G4S2]|uniref:putative sensor domain DACNV-containing protein n=1 Tax=Lysinibacillus sp. G4S2 TaxID=3055859 RepID=UPI0025A013D9|nr:diadenylate cyclase [Lysinibacillus sp. G4S2]MDM5250815.1 diadenylate cyclase [Lysinibacillus sp. G4S2]
MKIYPPDLLHRLQSIWIENRKELKTAPDLLTDEYLLEFLEVAYHASFLTEEDRRIKFRIAFANISESTLFNEHSYFDIIQFQEKRIFNVKEILKLAPATDLNQTIIGVNLENNRLLIWGLIHIGNSWSEYHFSRNRSAILPPNLLTVSVNEPGNIEISRFGNTLLKLTNGDLDSPISNCFNEGPISDFFDTPFNKMLIEFTNDLNLEIEAFLADEDNETPASIWGAYTGFIKCILNEIKKKKHGGSLIIIDSEDSEKYLKSFKIKYPCNFNSAWDTVKKSEISLYKSYESFFNILETDSVSIEEFKEYKNYNQELKKWDEKYMELHKLFASFSEVDGAVIIDNKLNLLGFGAEIIATSNLKEVHISRDTDGTSTQSIPMEIYGTRHRSVFRFCSKYKDSLAFIISQDGDIKAVTQVEDKLTLWTSIDLEN